MNGKARDGRPEEHHEYTHHPENDLVRWLRMGGEAIRPHLTTIAAVVAALLVLWGYMAWRRTSMDARRAAAWTEFFAEDYDAVVTKYQDTDALPYARMRIAENAYQEGRSKYLSKRNDAVRAFEKADEQLGAVASDANAPIDMRRNALFMKATAQESSGAPEKAKEQYGKVVSQYRDTMEAQIAEGRIKELSKKSATDFYRQFANYKPGERGPSKEPSIDDLIKGVGNPNPNMIIPSPPPVKGDGKKADTKDMVPTPPPVKKSAPPAPAPGKDLPEDKAPSKDASKNAKAPKTDSKAAPTKPAEPPKK